MADTVMKWYVVRAIGGQENKVKAYIETEISRVGLSDYVSQVIVPTEKVVQIRNGKKVNRERVYFPGYIMVGKSFRRSTSCNQIYNWCYWVFRRNKGRRASSYAKIRSKQNVR